MNKEEFYRQIKAFADSHNMRCELKQGRETLISCDWRVIVSYTFTWGNTSGISRSEIYYVKELTDSNVRYWHETIHNTKHHITGPNYGSVVEQKPMTLEKLCDRFLRELRHSAEYYDL